MNSKIFPRASYDDIEMENLDDIAPEHAEDDTSDEKQKHPKRRKIKLFACLALAFCAAGLLLYSLMFYDARTHNTIDQIITDDQIFSDKQIVLYVHNSGPVSRIVPVNVTFTIQYSVSNNFTQFLNNKTKFEISCCDGYFETIHSSIFDSPLVFIHEFDFTESGNIDCRRNRRGWCVFNISDFRSSFLSNVTTYQYSVGVVTVSEAVISNMTSSPYYFCSNTSICLPEANNTWSNVVVGNRIITTISDEDELSSIIAAKQNMTSCTMLFRYILNVTRNASTDQVCFNTRESSIEEIFEDADFIWENVLARAILYSDEESHQSNTSSSSNSGKEDYYSNNRQLLAFGKRFSYKKDIDVSMKATLG